MPAPPSLPPILLVHERGGHVEAVHRGAIAVVDASGAEIFSCGDPWTATWLRSAAKPFQAAAALRVGVADTFSLSSDEVALMCASHNGEDRHVETARRILARGDFTERDLRCGVHAPLGQHVVRQLARRGVDPSAIHNNCSGKHAGMLLFAKHLGADPARYLDPTEPVQRAIADAVSDICGCAAPFPTPATDGCSAVTFRMPLANLATGFLRLASPTLAPEAFAAPLETARAAMTTYPEMVAGLDRFDTDLMAAGRGRFVAKIGAEGLIGCGVVDKGLGIAIKVEDGTWRGYEPVLVALLERFADLTDEERARLRKWHDPILRNHVGTEIGRRHVVLEDVTG